MKKLRIIVPVVCLLVFIIAISVNSKQSNSKMNSYIDLVIEQSNEYINISNISKNMILGAMSQTDDFSSFQTKNTYDATIIKYSGDGIVGIGVTIVSHPLGAEVIGVFDFSPASRAGLKVGDIIISSDDIVFEGQSIEYVAAYTKGEEGSIFKLGVIKKDTTLAVYYDVKRENVIQKTVKSYIINGCGYIYISSFGNKTGEEVGQALEKFENASVNDVILDLRNNGGGTLLGSLETANYFLSGERLIKIDYKDSKYIDVSYRATTKEIDYNLVVLSNGHSASASEVVIGAIQDNEAGIIVGTQTYGKSIIQVSYELLTDEAYEKYRLIYDNNDLFSLSKTISESDKYSDQTDFIGAIKLTIGEYLTPNETSINNIGITPDEIIEYDDEIYIDKKVDNMIWIKDKYSIGMADAQILIAKEILELFAYEVGEMNDYYDINMENAVRQYQKDVGLYPYGVLDYTTQDALNNSMREIYLYEDIQLVRAIDILKEAE